MFGNYNYSNCPILLYDNNVTSPIMCHFNIPQPWSPQQHGITRIYHIIMKYSKRSYVRNAMNIVATPLWPSVGVKPNTSKVGNFESSGTPECLGFDNKAQNTSHWCVLGVIGKVLKRGYRKWPRIDHLDICRPSYGLKKGRESNWQFDSQPLKVRNRPLPNPPNWKCDMALKRSRRGLQLWLRLRHD